MLEKFIYVLKRPEKVARRDFVAELMKAGEEMSALSPAGLRLNVQDAGVDWGDAVEHHPALGRSSPDGPFEALVQVWLETGADAKLTRLQAIIQRVAPEIHGYAVEERLLVHNLLQKAGPGERNDGYSQVAMLQVPEKLPYEAWRSRWQDRHTWVALSIHPHLEYIQNVVTRPLSDACAPIAGFGEEAFPIVGLHDERPLFRGADDDDTYKRLYQVMYEDAARFIDFDRLDMMVSSQFDLLPPER